MRLGLILLAATGLGLGYVLYKINSENTNDRAQDWDDDWYSYEQPPVDGEVGDLLNQLVDHMHTYGQFYERKAWETYNCKQLTEQLMAMDPKSEEKPVLYEVMKHDVTLLNQYKNEVGPFACDELQQGWNIALKLREMRLHNPEQAALFDKCWEEIQPYAICEMYTHPSLSYDTASREEMLHKMNLKIVKRKLEYAQAHKERLQWEHEYNHIKGETVMAEAELQAAKAALEDADHVLATMFNTNPPVEEHILEQAYAQAEELALILKEAQTNVDAVDKVRMELETARLDMPEVNIEQVIIDHHQPGDELHPHLPQGVRIVPGNDTQPPPTGGSWWSEFMQWIWSWIG